MDPLTAQSPFSGLTLIAAPALLTNASCVLALGTINRMLRTRDSMRDLLIRSESPNLSDSDKTQIVELATRVEKQGEVLLTALRRVYLALGAFSGATLLTLIGAVMLPFQWNMWFQWFSIFGIALGAIGVTCLVAGSLRLFSATRLSLLNMRSEADTIRQRLGNSASMSRSTKLKDFEP
jgi:hypothetical protein